MLNGILSPAAAHLFDDLHQGRPILIDPNELDEGRQPESPAQELYRLGLVKQTYDDPPRLVAMEPRAAMLASIANLIDDISDRHRALSQTVDEALSLDGSLIETGLTNGTAPVRLLSDGAQIHMLSSALIQSARTEALILNTAEAVRPEKAESVGLDEDQRIRNVRLRSIYHVDCLPYFQSLIDASVAEGEVARISQHVPTKMIIIDGQHAMLPLDRTGTRGAVLIEASPILDALRWLFESIWDRAIPYSTESADLSPVERRVARLLAAGDKDEAIAQRLNVTVRTVRRHIAAVMTKLRVSTRFEAGVQAAKRGWV